MSRFKVEKILEFREVHSQINLYLPPSKYIREAQIRTCGSIRHIFLTLDHLV